MATPLGQIPSEWSEGRTSAVRFGAGLTETEVRRLQAILREDCGADLSLPQAWSRAIELLSLVEMLLHRQGIIDEPREPSTEFALPRS